MHLYIHKIPYAHIILTHLNENPFQNCPKNINLNTKLKKRTDPIQVPVKSSIVQSEWEKQQETND